MVLAGMLVRVVQLFLKVPALKALAPTQTEPPFVVTQLLVLLTFVVLGVFAVRRFKPATNDCRHSRAAQQRSAPDTSQATQRTLNITSASTSPSRGCANACGRRPTISKP
jgi:hypothetical protein